MTVTLVPQIGAMKYVNMSKLIAVIIMNVPSTLAIAKKVVLIRLFQKIIAMILVLVRLNIAIALRVVYMKMLNVKITAFVLSIRVILLMDAKL
jgi:hypothetical protein